jgi:hypothetical protein
VANLPPVLLIPVVHLDLGISPRILENFEITLVLFSGAWGKMTHEKKSEAKNLVTLYLKKIKKNHNFVVCLHSTINFSWFTLGYNRFDFFLENEEHRPFDGCTIEI